MVEINSFDAIQISLASPEKIKEWSKGEVTKPETINYRTQKPERDGLFCERIFGPTKDYECHCGKYKKVRYRGVICDKCGVEVTTSKVRRERMGHIELASPVSHIWYFRGVPSRISLILDITNKNIEKVIYYSAFVVIDPKDTKLVKNQVLSDEEYREAVAEYGDKAFDAGMGAEALIRLLRNVDLEEEEKELREIIATTKGVRQQKASKKLELVNAFLTSGNKPEWMILTVLPVIPPELRPMVQLDGGRFATSDLNDLYRRVINRNNRLKKTIEAGAPDIIVRNEKRMLQEAVDSLIDNRRHGKAVTGTGNRPLKSLTDMLRGKQGRFRQNLLGKRVDYSGRSVIVVGPELKIYQCGLPKEMALELFKPFVMKVLVDRGEASNIKSAKAIVAREKEVVWDVLEYVIKDHPVLLNRAPTLHRLGIQAFEPVLVEGRAIKLHPLVCSAFNADFDGDQMAVHVPLSIAAQVEARFLMLSTNNILKLSDGMPIVSPTQDMVLGIYYMTKARAKAKGEGRFFSNADEVKKAYDLNEISLQALINVKLTKVVDGVEYKKIINTTVGRLIFNEAIPQDLGFVDRTNEENIVDLEINTLVNKGKISEIVKACFKLKGSTTVAIMLDKIKDLGFKYSTLAAVTASVFDMHVPGSKTEILAEAEGKVLDLEKKYRKGIISDEQRHKEVVGVWTKATEDVANSLVNTFKETDQFNPIWMMVDSGARGNISQIKQLSGMRGVMEDPTGRAIESPVKASFREGLSVLEYFISSHGARKGGADTALKTADSGYFTRRLVDVSHDVIVKETDCGDTKGFEVRDILDSSGRPIEGLEERINGRFTVSDIKDPQTGEIIVKAGEMINEEQAKKIVAAGIKSVVIRSVLSCRSKSGICSKCYGANLSSWNPVKIGEAVGIIAAQSIGEPGTQLTMRTFHTGGVASSADITRGLPRVIELFEARKPKGAATVASISGTISITEEDLNGYKQVTISITPNNEGGNVVSQKLPIKSKVIVEEGQTIKAGDPLTAGSINPQDILTTVGHVGVQEIMIKEVQAAYRSNGVKIQDKHIEVIVRQMLKKVRVTDIADSKFIPGQLVDRNVLVEENDRIIQNDGNPAQGKRVLLGITKAALATDSFLSAASFQETAKVLAEAAINGAIDRFEGLKENVIIGKLIPSGTGMKRYKSVRCEEVLGTGKNPENAVEKSMVMEQDPTLFSLDIDDPEF